jgi:hypothetical protein
MPPAPDPTRSRLLLPCDACQPQAGTGAPSQSMLPTLTVQPVMIVLPAGMLNVLQGTMLPDSKLPF